MREWPPPFPSYEEQKNPTNKPESHLPSLTTLRQNHRLIATFWGMTTARLRIQYLAGLFLVVVLGQFVTPIVISYAIWHMDDFSWGKTREVEVTDDPDSKPAHS